MRFLLSLVALCALSSVPLRASDIFNITLTGDLSGSGTFTTDGICTLCEPGLGLLSLTINIGPDSGTDAFDISDDFFSGPPPTFYDRPPNQLSYGGVNSETGDTLNMLFFSQWELLRGTLIDTGTFTVTPAPELGSLFLLMPIVTVFGLRWRHQRHRA